MISEKMIFFPCLVTFRKNARENILQCLTQRKKIKNKTHPNTTGMDKKPTTTLASHPTNPPRATPQPTPTHRESTKNPPATHETHCTKPKNQAQNQPNPINSNPSAHLHLSPATQKWQKSNPNRRSGKKKKKNRNPNSSETKPKPKPLICQKSTPTHRHSSPCRVVPLLA